MVERPPAVEEALAAFLAREKAAWPPFALDDDAFMEDVAAKLGADGDVPSALAGLHAADMYLAAACASHHPKALAEFERLYVAEVPRSLSRLAPSADFVKEVQQALRDKLLVPQGERRPRIADYSGRGALGAWVRVAALRTALSMRRGRKEALARDGAIPDQAAPATDPDALAVRKRYRGALKTAMQSALASLPEEDRTLLRMHVIEGLSVAELGERHGVHGSTISRRITRIRAAVLEEARRQLSVAERLRESEFRSVVRVLQSDLDVSIERILGA